MQNIISFLPHYQSAPLRRPLVLEFVGDGDESGS
jgi:hypothetical protein